MLSARGFSLIEILVVVAVIAIFATIALSILSGTSQQANEVVARQQQAELQTALGNWIAAASSAPGGLAEARSRYSGASDKLSLLSDYLQPATLQRLSNSASGISSSALIASGARLYFTAPWTATNSPSVVWSNTP